MPTLSRKKIFLLVVCTLVAMGLSLSAAAQSATPAQTQQNVATLFATLPFDHPGHPEGLAADGDGNIYAASFELSQFTGGSPFSNDNDGDEEDTHNFFPPRKIGSDGNPVPPPAFNYIYVFGPDGSLKTAMPMPSMVVPLGLWVVGDNLYVNDVINGDELRYQLPLTTSSTPAQTYHICGGFKQAFPGGDASTFCALNSNYRGPDGRIYMSDNGAGPSVAPPGFPTGRIFVLDPVSGASSLFFDPPGHELDIVPNGFPPFGVNGIAFDRAGTALYMDNMSDGGIFKLTVTNCNSACSPGQFSVVVPPFNGIIVGPDNMDFDDNGNLWVASGQNMTVVGIDPQGHVMRQVGIFSGFSDQGVPLSLLQPSGIVFSHGRIFVGNEANRSLLPAVTPINLGLMEASSVASFRP